MNRLVGEIHERHVHADHAKHVANTDDHEYRVLEERQVEHVLQHVLGDLGDTQTAPDDRFLLGFVVSRDRRDAAHVRPDVRLRPELRDAHDAAAVEDVLPVERSRVVLFEDALRSAAVHMRVVFVDAVGAQFVRAQALHGAIVTRSVDYQRRAVGESVRQTSIEELRVAVGCHLSDHVRRQSVA